MQWLFDNWESLARTAAVSVMAYIALVFLLRISGRRTLSKMNAFDLVITVSLGSTLATVVLNQQVTLAQGALAFALLIGMQYAVTWSSVRVTWIRKVVTGEPALLFYDGRYLSAALLQARVTREEIRAAVRSTGLEAMNEIKAVVLETDGSFSVVRQGDKADLSSLDGVRVPANDLLSE